jgi:hypothetical protein
MKLAYNRDEVAVALGKTTQEFEAILPKLEAFGFPKAIRGLEDRWSIMEVVNWVNNTSDPGQIPN